MNEIEWYANQQIHYQPGRQISPKYKPRRRHKNSIVINITCAESDDHVGEQTQVSKDLDGDQRRVRRGAGDVEANNGGPAPQLRQKHGANECVPGSPTQAAR